MFQVYQSLKQPPRKPCRVIFEDSNLQTPIVHVSDVVCFALTSTNPVTRINRVKDANDTRLKIGIHTGLAPSWFKSIVLIFLKQQYLLFHSFVGALIDFDTDLRHLGFSIKNALKFDRLKGIFNGRFLLRFSIEQPLYDISGGNCLFLL